MTCPICSGGGREIEVARHYMNDPLYVCEDCGLVHADRKSPEETFQAWEDWPDNYDPAWPAARARLVYVAEFLKQHNLLNDVFDISMGDEFFLSECNRRGATVCGISRSIEETQYLGHHQVVCINWTLENTADPVGMLRWAAKHGEYVCVAMGSRILVPFKKPLQNYIDKSPAWMHPNHFSFNTLAMAMNRAGLVKTHYNRHVDSDCLIQIGKPFSGPGEPLAWGDHPDEVIDFFERWHEDSKCYAKG